MFRPNRSTRSTNRSAEKQIALIAATVPMSLWFFYRDLAKDLNERGIEVHFVSSPGAYLQRVEPLVDKVYQMDYRREISPMRDIEALLRTYKLMRQLRPTIVIAGTPKASLLALTAAKAAGVPTRAYHLLGLRLEGETGPARAVLAALEFVTSWCSSVVIAVSPSLSEAYATKWFSAGRKIVVPGSGSTHGVDVRHFQPKPKSSGQLMSLGLDETLPTLVFVGRLTHDKGPDLLVQLMTELNRRNRRVQLLVVGPQDEPDSANAITALTAISSRVRLVGHQDDVRPFLALADMLILPTRREGLPNVALEAAAMGKPVVTTPVTGAVDAVVPGVTGIVISEMSGKCLADAVEHVLSDPERAQRMGAEGRAWVTKHFNPSRVARATADAIIGA